MDFDEIVQESRESKFALVLDGVELNLTMLALEMFLDDSRLTVAKETLGEVLAHMKMVAGKKRFVELTDLRNLPEITPEAVKEMLEGKLLDGAPDGANAGDGSR